MITHHQSWRFDLLRLASWTGGLYSILTHWRVARLVLTKHSHYLPQGVSLGLIGLSKKKPWEKKNYHKNYDALSSCFCWFVSCGRQKSSTNGFSIFDMIKSHLIETLLVNHNAPRGVPKLLLLVPSFYNTNNWPAAWQFNLHMCRYLSDVLSLLSLLSASAECSGRGIVSSRLQVQALTWVEQSSCCVVATLFAADTGQEIPPSVFCKGDFVQPSMLFIMVEAIATKKSDEAFYFMRGN